MTRNKLSVSLIINLTLIVVCVVSVIPMILTISISITDTHTIEKMGYQLIPQKFSLQAYEWIFQDPQQIITGYKNSILITGVGTVLNLLVTALIAYPLSRRDFAFRGIISAYIFFTMIFSGGLVPFYILIVKYLHWKNMLISLIIPGIAAPFNIFLLRVFFQDIPPSLTEAAKIDGSSDVNSFFKIILPLSKPAMATLALMIALSYWNEVFQAMLFIDSAKNYPIQLILNNIVDAVNEIKQGNAMPGSPFSIDPNSVPSDSIMFAMMVVATLPMVFLFTFLQKYFVKGMTVGAVKG